MFLDPAGSALPAPASAQAGRMAEMSAKSGNITRNVIEADTQTLRVSLTVAPEADSGHSNRHCANLRCGEARYSVVPGHRGCCSARSSATKLKQYRSSRRLFGGASELDDWRRQRRGHVARQLLHDAPGAQLRVHRGRGLHRNAPSIAAIRLHLVHPLIVDLERQDTLIANARANRLARHGKHHFHPAIEVTRHPISRRQVELFLAFGT